MLAVEHALRLKDTVAVPDFDTSVEGVFVRLLSAETVPGIVGETEGETRGEALVFGEAELIDEAVKDTEVVAVTVPD